MLSGFCGMVRSVMEMALGDMGMVRGDVGVARFMARGSFAMMARRVLVMFGGFAVMLDGWIRHNSSFVEDQQPRWTLPRIHEQKVSSR
jgi:hypothetical protein